MRRVVASIIAVALLVALGVVALAEEVQYLYCVEDDVPVYAEKDRESKVVKKLEEGEEVEIKELSKSRKWYAIYYEKKGKRKVGWVEAKYLTEERPCKHKWGEWRVYREPTCVKPGLRIRTCTLCGAAEAVDIECIPHEFGKWKVVKEATCTQEGLQVRVCKVCGFEDKKKAEKLPHDFGAWEIVEEATCAEKGMKVRTCLECGYEEEKEIDKLPHTFGDWKIVIEATDHSSGTKRRTCRVCGASERTSYDPDGTLRKGDRGEPVREIQQLLADQGYLKGSGVDGIFGSGVERAIKQFQEDQGLEADGVAWPQTINRLYHDFGPWRTVKKLTRNSDGERVRECVECGYEQREVIPASATYERRARGEAIRTLQNMLNDMDYGAGTADGIYGQKLDNAFDTFALDYGVDDFEPGQVRPTDIDALVNAWIAECSKADWKGHGGKSTPVNLVLRVNAAEGTDPTDDMLVFNWTLKNAGSEKCRFDALLLNFGETDFTEGNLVLAVDGTTLRPSGANELKGSVSVARSWGAGKLCFCALGVSEKTGAVWLSNGRSYVPEE